VVIVTHENHASASRVVEAVEAAGPGLVGEIIVVDNGSSPETVAGLESSLANRVRLLVLGTDRYFGEGANIGVETATGGMVLLLHDDVRPEPGCIEELVRYLADNPSAAAVGPLLVDPDGTSGRAGGTVSESGEIVYRTMPVEDAGDNRIEAVDFCSAACLLVRRADFMAAGGFDLRWEPAFYEDVDLCFELRRLGRSVVVDRQARATSLESPDPGEAEQAAINRLAFVNKWILNPAEPPSSHRDHNCENPPTATGRIPGVTTAMLFDPYDIVPGGGERVLFELGAALADVLGDDQVSLAVPHPYSNLRIEQVRRVFGLRAPKAAVTYDDARGRRPDLAIVLGNEATPPVPGFGTRHNVYLCQFPVHTSPEYLEQHLPYIGTYDQIWVYSDFVRRYVNGHLRLLGVHPPPIRVVYAPATVNGSEAAPPWLGRRGLITVGRFFAGGHNKRQDVVIEIVREVERRLGRRVPLTMIGSLHPGAGSRERFAELRAMAGDIDCRFFPNASRERLIEEYGRSAILLHATGYGIDPLAFPEQLEHFGIVPVEAAGLGCIPVVYGQAGPAEVMRLLGSDTTFDSIPDAAGIVARLLDDPDGAGRLSEELVRRARMFSQEAFRERIFEALSADS
jgi:hypothetical protein